MDMINKGRETVISLIMILLLLEVLGIGNVVYIKIVRSNIDAALYQLLTGIVRFILTILLLFFLYKGHRLAKWISIVLFGIAGLRIILSISLILNIMIFVVVVALFFIYKGYHWVKWILVVLLVIAGALTISSTSMILNVMMFIMGVTYIYFCTILIGSKSMNNFFLYQRGEVEFQVDEAISAEDDDSSNI